MGGSEVVTITYTIDSDYQGSTIVDWAEISFATDTDGSAVNATDIDSQADGDNFNSPGETDDLDDQTRSTLQDQKLEANKQWASYRGRLAEQFPACTLVV